MQIILFNSNIDTIKKILIDFSLYYFDYNSIPPSKNNNNNNKIKYIINIYT